jgi:hypothetical protein
MSLRRSQRLHTTEAASATENSTQLTTPFGSRSDAVANATSCPSEPENPKSTAIPSCLSSLLSVTTSTNRTQDSYNMNIAKALGARCTIHLNQDKDFFGGNRNLSGWYPATIERICKSHKTLTARLDDNSQEEKVLFKDVRMLRRGTTDADRSIFYWNVDGEERIFSDQRPVVLYPGDLVQACFRNGHFPLNPGAWYRGRVAAIHKSAQGSTSTLANIAYDDDDLEMDVPYDASVGNITLLERGFDNPSWLDGLTAPSPCKKWKTCQTGLIQRTEPNQPVQIRYSVNGNDVIEKRSYGVVVKALFASEIDQGQKRVCHWLVPQRGIDVASDVLPSPKKEKSKAKRSAKQESKRARIKSPPASRDDNEEEDPEEEKVRRKAIPSRKPKAKKAAAPQAATNGNNDAAVEEKPKAKLTAIQVEKESLRHQPQAATRKTVSQKATRNKGFDLVDEDVESVAETLWNLEVDPPLPEPPRALKPIDVSLAHNFGKALNSCDAALGADFLTFMATMHGKEILLLVLICLSLVGIT